MIKRLGSLLLPTFAGPLLIASLLVGCGAVSENLSDAEAAIPPPVAGADARQDSTGPGDLQVRVRPVVEIPTEWNSEIEEVYGRYWLYWEAFAAAHGPPRADPAHEALRELSTARNWESISDQLRGFAGDDLVLTLPERSVTEHLLRLPNASVLTKNEGDEIVLQDCWIDDFIQQTLTGHIVSEANEAKLMNVTMKVEDGIWRVDGVTKAATDSDGYQQCAELISS